MVLDFARLEPITRDKCVEKRARRSARLDPLNVLEVGHSHHGGSPTIPLALYRNDGVFNCAEGR